MRDFLEAEFEQIHVPAGRRWQTWSLDFGLAAVVLLFGCLAQTFQDEQWEESYHRHVGATIDQLRGYSGTVPPGLMSGVSGLAYALRLGPTDDRAHELLAMLDKLIIQSIEADQSSLTSIIEHGATWRDYDIISGRAGIARYLLSTNTLIGRYAVKKLCDFLIALVMNSDNMNLFICNPPLPSTAPVPAHRRLASIQIGLAHGMCGVLAVLSIACMNGIQSHWMRTSIARLANWVIEAHRDDNFGPNWYSASYPSEVGTSEDNLCQPSWCYGSPGISTSLWLGSQALASSRIEHFATQSALAIVRRGGERWGLISPIVCHGIAGLLQVIYRFHQRTGLQDFGRAHGYLLDQLLCHYSPALPLGFQNVGLEDWRSDSVGLLNGVVGILLVLSTAIAESDPRWDEILLLA